MAARTSRSPQRASHPPVLPFAATINSIRRSREKTAPRAEEPRLASEHVAKARRLGFQIAFIMAIGGEDMRHALHHLDARAREACDLLPVIGHQPHGRGN